MSPTARLLEVTDALTEAGLQLLIMVGHAVRHYGVDRNTFDFDFHVSADSAGQLEDRLRRTRLFSGGELKEGVSWRRDDFRRFQIGVLPNDREEWLEFWFRNHLLAPFPQLFERREEALASGRRLCFRLQPGSARHLAIVEAVRLAYQRAAKAADHADKERHQVRTQNPT